LTAGGRDHAGIGDSSLRHRRIDRRFGPIPFGAAVVAGLVVLVAPLAFQRWFGGDLLYHSGLTSAILRGEFLPGGPYEGLPAYYPPGFHVVLTAIIRVLGTDFEWAVRILTVVWLPVLPVGTFVLARHLTGRRDVALLATALTLFGGGFDFTGERTWVNSLFMSGQAAAPVYPRDIVFGILPWAMLAAIRGLESTSDPGRAYLRWAAAAGILLGIAALTQIQLLLPVPFAIAAVALVRAVRHPGARRLRLALVVVVIGLVAALAVLPWIVAIAGEIARGGGVSLDSSDFLQPLRLGFWDVPRQFGLLLPFAFVGVGVTLLFLRGTGPRPPGEPATRWRPSTPESPLLLAAWAGLPFVLAFAYSPAWPLEDALRPQRLFLLASQPMAILAAVGIVTAAEDLRVRWRRPVAVPVAMALAVLATTLPTAAITAYRAGTAFATPIYAHLDLVDDRVPDFRRIVPGGPGRTGVLTYEDWSALAWYETAAWIVAMDPPGYSKLAFDPAVFTGRSQGERRIDLFRAFDGDPASLAGIADRFGMDLIVVAKRDGRLGLIDQTAAVIPAADPAAVRGPWSILEGNGWDALELESRSSVAIDAGRGGFVHLAIRAQSARERGRSVMRLIATAADGSERTLLESIVDRAGRLENWPVIEWFGDLAAGESVRIEAGAALYVQSIRGYVDPPDLPAGWVVRVDEPDFVVLGRAPAR
jgi:hypothetical protein